ncbi:hypothetical protein AB0B89_36495, partial [Sphaerisporangium sp. NPDC049002]|uniref:hypothetical protein n=1 Tax=Sphaerisporangium sp. NPDC049002 TaxID=3155392 RepID=UPI0033C17994
VKAIRNRTGISTRMQQGYRAESGLEFTVEPWCAPGAGDIQVKQEYRARAEEVLKVIAIYESEPLADPFDLVRRLGMMDQRTHSALSWEACAPPEPYHGSSEQTGMRLAA